MATEEVGVRLSVKGRREASRDLRGVAGDLDHVESRARRAALAGDRLGTSLGKGIGGLARGAGAAAAGIGLLGVAAGGIMARFVSDAAESARISRLTEAAIKSTGGAANITASQVGLLAESISNKTAVDDEAIQSASNLLLTFTKVRNEAGKGNDIFNQATQAAVDMSAALGTDAAGAAMQLGKALNDPVKGVGALSRAGVSFTAQQKDQIKEMVKAGDTLGAQRLILSEMQTQFGGAAAAAADPIERLRVITGNLGERIGTMLLPHVERFATYLTNTGVPKVKAFLDEFDRGVGAGGRLRDRLTELRDRVITLWTEFQTGTGTGGQFRDALGTMWDTATLLGGVLREYVLPALAWFNDNPEALAGVAASMAAMAVSARVIAAANVINGLLALGGASGMAAAAGAAGGKDGKGKDKKGGKLPGAVGFLGSLGATAWGIDTARDAAGQSWSDIFTGSDEEWNWIKGVMPGGGSGPSKKVVPNNSLLVPDALDMPGFSGGGGGGWGKSEVNVYIGGEKIADPVVNEVLKQEARR